MRGAPRHHSPDFCFDAESRRCALLRPSSCPFSLLEMNLHSALTAPLTIESWSPFRAPVFDTKRTLGQGGARAALRCAARREDLLPKDLLAF